MEHVLQVEKREIGSKSFLKNIRKKGGIPAIIYGSSSEPLSVTVNAREFRKSFAKITESAIIHLNIAGHDSKDVLIKDYQHDTIQDEIVHLDFYEIQKGKMLKTLVPIEMEGSPEGLKFGGVIETFIHEVEVESLPKDLPEKVVLDITALAVGQSLHISDLPSVEGVKYLNSPEQVIVHMGLSKKEVASTSEEQEDGDTTSES